MFLQGMLLHSPVELKEGGGRKLKRRKAGGGEGEAKTSSNVLYMIFSSALGNSYRYNSNFN